MSFFDSASNTVVYNTTGGVESDTGRSNWNVVKANVKAYRSAYLMGANSTDMSWSAAFIQLCVIPNGFLLLCCFWLLVCIL